MAETVPTIPELVDWIWFDLNDLNLICDRCSQCENIGLRWKLGLHKSAMERFTSEHRECLAKSDIEVEADDGRDEHRRAIIREAKALQGELNDTRTT